MPYSDLITLLLRHGPFADAEDAALALTTTLETLGYVLPARLVRELETELPDQCGWPLAFGRSVSDKRQRVARGTKRLAPALPADTVERIQEVWATLERALPAALVQDIVRELPRQLSGAFQARAVSTLLPPSRAREPESRAQARPKA